MTRADLTNVALAAWAAMALFTFGHSASQPKVCLVKTEPSFEWEKCRNGPLAVDGFLSAVFWPLYWSWELQQ